MSVNLSALAGAGQQFFDNNGVILSGGKLYSYAAGTTTPQAAYTSASGSTPHTNPIILNSAGRVATGEIWLTAGENYKFSLFTSADVLIATWDNITGINGTGITSNASTVVYDPAGLGAVATTVQAKLRESVSVKDFGALGNDDQTLYATSYQTDTFSGPVTITQQTLDGLAINKAILYLRSIGGGSLYFPKGIYRTWAYFETIDFPCLIYGDGIDVSTVKNCDASPTNTSGYGIFECGGKTPGSPVGITFTDITLNGNAVVRLQPTGEFRCYPIVFYGSVVGAVSRVKSINSPIDCFTTVYENTEVSSMRVSDCIFDNSFRNTVSLVGGWNQSFVNCSISGGGQVQGGTNPKYCLDIEPNSVLNPIKDISFTNCHLFNAANVIIGGVWCEAQFSNCVIEAYGNTLVGYPWAFQFSQAQIDMTGCRINGKAGELSTIAVNYPLSVAGAYQYSQYLKLVGCTFYGCGYQGVGVRSILQDCLFMNSAYPVYFSSGTTGLHSVSIENVTLINVIDSANYGSGANSSFAILNSTEGPVYINGLHIRIDPDNLPTLPAFTYFRVYGIFLSGAGLTFEAKISNVHVAGFYEKYPTATGQVINSGFFRDWNAPSLPPANTAGQIAGPAAIYYANCTMYGNSP